MDPTLLVAVVLLGIPALAIHAIRSTHTPPRDCLTCGRTVPDGELLVERPDLRICEACVAGGRERLHATGREGSSGGPFGLRCHFCGTHARPELPVLQYAQAAVCRDCLQICEGYLQPQAEWVEHVAEARIARDDGIKLVLWILGMGGAIAILFRDCGK